MPLTVTKLAPENVSSAELAKAFTDPRPASYALEYFSVTGAASVARDILAYGEADWEDKHPASWAEPKAPFGVLPVLHIRTADGVEFKLAETVVIDHYLAKKFGLLGNNEWEEQQIKVFHSSSLFLRERLASRVIWNYKNIMDKTTETFLTKTLPVWIETHTAHLKDNGSNGHYVGNRLSLADLQTANTIDMIAIQYKGQEMVDLIKQSPEIWKVKEAVDNEPKLQKWRQSEEYKTLIKQSLVLYGNAGIP
ncbi:Glutathione S-transferase S1 [Haplosporangium sp. Z 27]|nr:Glutathione S-transferase S1 [Haplosporangium sp. Z 27]